MPYLTQDIVGTASRFTYGKKGDKVEIYSDHNNVLIVERSDGLRFSVKTIHLSNEKVDRDVDKIPDVRRKNK